MRISVSVSCEPGALHRRLLARVRLGELRGAEEVPLEVSAALQAHEQDVLAHWPAERYCRGSRQAAIPSTPATTLWAYQDTTKMIAAARQANP